MRRTANSGFGLARLLFGLGAVAAPSAFGATWIGAKTASKPNVQVVLRALGVRDMALGAGTLAGSLSGRPQPWLMASVAADIGDIAATLLGRDRLPDQGIRNTLLLASSAAAAGTILIAADMARETSAPSR